MTQLPDRIASGEVEAPDLFCGGTPCQAFSVAGLRKSLDDARGNLSLVFCEIANAIDTRRAGAAQPPAIIFWENVPGVLSTKDNAFGCFLAGLAGEEDPVEPPRGKWPNAGVVLGPQRTAAWRILDAQYFGLAQRRRRVFVVASARDDFDPASVLFEFGGVRRDTAPSREAGQIAPTIPARSTAGGGLGTDFDCDGGVIQAFAIQAGALRTNPASGPDGVGVQADHAYTLEARAEVQAVAQPIGFNARQDPDAWAGRTGPLDTDGSTQAIAFQPGNLSRGAGASPSTAVFPTLKSDHGRGASDQDPHVAVCVTGDVTHTLKAEGFDASEDGTGRGQPIVPVAVAFQERGRIDGRSLEVGGDVAYALTAPDGGGRAQERNVMTPNMQVRRLTPVECERLQGFPDTYTQIPWRKKPAEDCPDGPRYKALGNSWAVPVVRWIGTRIHNAVARPQEWKEAA